MAFLRTAIRCSVFYRKYGLQGGGGSSALCCIQKVAKSSAAAASTSTIGQGNTTAIQQQQPQKDPLDITFEDAKAAFKSKTNWELIRAYIVYTLCSFEYLVDNNMKVSVEFYNSIDLLLCKCVGGWFTGRRRRRRDDTIVPVSDDDDVIVETFFDYFLVI